MLSVSSVEPEVQGYLMGPARAWRSSVDGHMGMRGFRFSLDLDWACEPEMVQNQFREQASRGTN